MPAPWLQIDSLSVAYPVRRGVFARTVARVHALSSVSLALRRGEILGLAGESGCGKTTLGRTLCGLEHPSSGRILLEGRPLRLPDTRLQMVFQDPSASLNPRLPVRDLLLEAPLARRLVSRRDADSLAGSLLREVGLPPSLLWRYPFELSGGQRQRVAIARALALRPELLVCDEITSALDVSVQAQVLNLLLDLRTSRNLTLLLVSHDLGVLRRVSDRIAVMYLGHLVELAPADALVSSPRHPYTQALLRAVPVPFGPRTLHVLPGEPPSPLAPPPGCPFHPRCPRADGLCRTVPPPPVSPDTPAACHHPLP